MPSDVRGWNDCFLEGGGRKLAIGYRQEGAKCGHTNVEMMFHEAADAPAAVSVHHFCTAMAEAIA